MYPTELVIVILFIMALVVLAGLSFIGLIAWGIYSFAHPEPRVVTAEEQLARVRGKT